jgi:hypothetical protein
MVGKSLVLITLCMDIAEPTLAVAARGRIGGVVLEEGRVEAALMLRRGRMNCEDDEFWF